MDKIDLFLSGEKLYGDDSSLEEIEEWYNDEKEGYANLGAKNKETYRYNYHNLNKLHAYNFLPKKLSFNNVLGLGSAYGKEFLPIIDRINNLFIIEPSDHLISNKLGKITPTYVKPDLSGKIDFPDNHFDLIVCFGTLHHIPNVSYVMSELHRCLKPGGYLLIREPIHSMREWWKPRPGTTLNERGIPIKFFRKLIKSLNFKIVKENVCFTLTPFLVKLFKQPIHKSKFYLMLDKAISQILKFRAFKYYRKSVLSKIAPSVVVYVLKK